MSAPAWRARIAACAAAVASALGIALFARVRWPWVWLCWVALVPWLGVLARATSARAALAAGVLMCEAFALVVFSWFPSAIQNYTALAWPLALLLVVLVAPLLEPQFIAFALAHHLARRHRAHWWHPALVGACIYVGTEWALPKLFADTLGQALYASVLMRQAADLAGAHGLTFILLIGNACVLAALRLAVAPRRAVTPVAMLAALILGLCAYGALRVSQFEGDKVHDAAPVSAVLVQANISKYGQLAAEMGTFDATRMILDTHFGLSTDALRRAPADLLVWPETVYPTTFGSPKSDDGAAFDREIAAFVARMGIPLVFGAYDAEAGDEFNAAMFLQPTADGKLAFESYRKRWLFPLIERAPALLDSPSVRRWLPWLGTWKSGTGSQVISLTLRNGRTLRVAPLICYDAIDSGLALSAVRQGADLLVTLSNDSWFDYGDVPRLILVLSAFRSIETRRPQIRATNTGVSAVITASGELVHTVGMDRRETVVAAVTPESRATTLMLAWGDWFGPTALAVGIGLLAVSRFGRSVG